MKLSWIFGSSMEARHLLYVYVSVWLIQGGYAVWILRQWVRTKKPMQPPVPLEPVTRDDS